MNKYTKHFFKIVDEAILFGLKNNDGEPVLLEVSDSAPDCLKKGDVKINKVVVGKLYGSSKYGFIYNIKKTSKNGLTSLHWSTGHVTYFTSI